MEIYKTVILGKTVHFIIKGRAQDLDKSFQNAVFVYPSLRCDFDLEYNKDELSFDSDISAGFGLFLSRVRGYPVSDYELLTREGYRAFRLDNKVFCSSVGKCKVLCTNKQRELCGSNIPISYVMTPRGEFAITLCEDAQGFSEEKLCAAILMLRGELGYPFAALGLADCGDGVRLLGRRSDKEPPGAYSYAAAATLLMSLYGSSEVSLIADEGRILVGCVPCGVKISAYGGFVGRIY